MKVLKIQQGSDDWKSVRRKYNSASQAPAMMGVGHITRSDLLQQRHTGIEPEVSDFQQAIFDKGHAIEAQARQIAEAMIGEELFPVTAVCDGDWLLASFDGITIDQQVIWECKSFNQAKVESIKAGECPEVDYYQVQHQLYVSGASKCLYMVTDGTEENTHTVWVEPNESDMGSLVRGWQQFDDDLANYVYQPPEVEAVGKAPDQLPALRIEVTGAVTASNLSAFRDHALAVFDGINTDLQNDGDFADAEKTVKWCKDVESRLESAKDHALAQTASIDELFRAIDDIKEQARVKRLELEKLVKARKDAIRREVVMDANEALMAHINKINAALDVPVPHPHTDFACAIKGKRTIASLRDAVDTLLAKAKIEISETAELIRENCKVIDAAGKPFLFSDKAAMALKDAEWVTGMVAMRVAEHEQAEQKRLEAERERIRAEEEAKLKAAPQPVEREAKEAPVARSVESKPTARPTDASIIEAVAKAFSVDRRTACAWIADVGARIAA